MKATALLGVTVTVTVDRPLGSFHPEHKTLNQSKIRRCKKGVALIKQYNSLFVCGYALMRQPLFLFGSA